MIDSVIPHSKPFIDQDDIAAVSDVLRTGMIAEGSLVQEFEQATGAYLGLDEGIASSSGTAALYLGLKALDVGPGDEVILPTYVCRSVWDAIVQAGAKAVFCDISENWCVNADTVKPHITEKTRAIIVVHIFGIVADIEPICELGIPVIEDCCQAFGAQKSGKFLGSFGELCILSFHATKLLATGEGGMALSKNKELIEKIRYLKQGETKKLAVRYRATMTDLQAALGLSQLRKYQTFLERRTEIANQYFDKMSDLPVKLPLSIRERSIFFRFPVRVKLDFDTLRKKFDRKGIQVRRGVDTLLHVQAINHSEEFPVAGMLFKETVSLPLYPSLDDSDCEHVIYCCQHFFSELNP